MKLQNVLSGFLLVLAIGINAQSNPGSSLTDASTDSVYAILLPQLSGPDHPVDSLELKIIDGVVFYNSPIWKPEEDFEDTEKWSEYRDEYMKHTSQSDAYRLQDLNIAARHLYLSGCLNSVDMGSPMWGGGDGYRNFFIGDTAGTLTIGYHSGIADVIPLIFGYTAWWHDNYQSNFAPFRSDPAARKQLSNALCVVNGIDGYNQDIGDYYLKIVLRDEQVDWIEFKDNPERIGYYSVDGLTFGNPRPAEKLDEGIFLIEQGVPVSESWADSIKELLVFSTNPYPEGRQQAIQRLRNNFYTSLEDINDSVISATPPDILPQNFPGPKVTFTGTSVATLLTRIYYENSMQILGRVDPDGMVHESEKGADNYQGFPPS